MVGIDKIISGIKQIFRMLRGKNAVHYRIKGKSRAPNYQKNNSEINYQDPVGNFHI